MRDKAKQKLNEINDTRRIRGEIMQKVDTSKKNVDTDDKGLISGLLNTFSFKGDRNAAMGVNAGSVSKETYRQYSKADE